MCVGKSSPLRSRPRGESRCWRRARCPRPLTWRQSRRRLLHPELQPPLGQWTPTSPPHPRGSHTTSWSLRTQQRRVSLGAYCRFGFYVRSQWVFFALCISVHASYGMLGRFQCYINEVICIVGSCLSKSCILELVASTTCDLNSAIMFNCGSIVLNRMWWIEGEKEHYILMLFSLP